MTKYICSGNPKKLMVFRGTLYIYFIAILPFLSGYCSENHTSKLPTPSIECEEYLQNFSYAVNYLPQSSPYYNIYFSPIQDIFSLEILDQNWGITYQYEGIESGVLFAEQLPIISINDYQSFLFTINGVCTFEFGGLVEVCCVCGNPFEVYDDDGDGFFAHLDCDESNPFVHGLVNTIGSPCEDENENTYADEYIDKCTCQGKPLDYCVSSMGDADLDGICDEEDGCLSLYGTVGSYCNDGIYATHSDAISSDCICTGIYSAISASAISHWDDGNESVYTITLTGGSGIFHSPNGQINGPVFVSDSMLCDDSHNISIFDDQGSIPLILSNFTVQCNNDLEDDEPLQLAIIDKSCQGYYITFTFQIIGGTPPYQISGDYIDSDAYYPEFSIDLQEGWDYTIEVTDANNESASISESNVFCCYAYCVNQMPDFSYPSFYCGTSEVSIPEGAPIIENWVEIGIALYDFNPDTVLYSLLEHPIVIIEGTNFLPSEIPNLELNKTYYARQILYNYLDSGENLPLCRIYSELFPITFGAATVDYEVLSINEADNTCEGSFTFYGSPNELSSDLTIQSEYFSGNIAIGQAMVLDQVPLNTPIIFHILDPMGCEADIEIVIDPTDCTIAGGDEDGDGICSNFDTCPSTFAAVGSPCEDSDECTTSTTIQADCSCGGGVLLDEDNDLICDTDPLDTCNGANIGEVCEDSDECTISTTIQADCSCGGGVLFDEDNDLICDTDPLDTCNGANIGEACDDNNPNTSIDIVQANCSCSGTTGIQTSGSSMITIHPNPTTTFFMITQSGVQMNQCQVYNQMGQLVLSQTIDKPSQIIEVSSLENGLYFIQMKDDTQQLYSSKLVIVR